MPRLVPIIANGWVDNVVIVQYTTGLFITSAISNTSPISTLGAVYSSIDSQVMLLLLTFSSSPTCVYNTNRVVSKAKLTTWGGCLGFPSTKFVINSIPVGTSYTHPQLSLSLILWCHPFLFLSSVAVSNPGFSKRNPSIYFQLFYTPFVAQGRSVVTALKRFSDTGGERRVLTLKRDSFQIKKETR